MKVDIFHVVTKDHTTTLLSAGDVEHFTRHMDPSTFVVTQSRVPAGTYHLLIAWRGETSDGASIADVR